MNIIKPLFIGAYIAMIAYMPISCAKAFDYELQMQEETGKRYYQEMIEMQQENPNP